MEIKIKHVLLTAIAVVGGYQLYKHSTKPKDGEAKSSASGPQAGALKYNKNTGKVLKVVADGFGTNLVQLAPQNQPKAMDWYKFNGKWVWTKWNGKLDTDKISHKDLVV